MDMLPDKEFDPSEPPEEAGEPSLAGEPNVPAEEPAVEAEEASAAPEGTPSGEPQAERRRPSFDEALGEMRQSLREEETKEQTGFGAGLKRWVRKVFRRKTAPLPEVTEARLDEFAIPEAPALTESQPPAEAVIEEPASTDAGQEAAGAVEEERPPSEARSFEKLVRNKITGALPGKESMEPLVAPVSTPETATEDEALDYLAPGQTHLKEQPEEVGAPGQSILTAIRGEEQESQELSSIRQAALEDYQVAPTEEELAEEAAPLPRRLRRGWRDMRPIDRTLLTGVLGILGVVIVVLVGITVWPPPPPPTPTVVPTTSITPIPISLSLPGGWVFPLKIGRVDPDGVWRPQGAEWLEGTEVCRWVSLPHTVQLEAVIRTLKADDPLQLSMSNYDSIVFKVKSIEQITPTPDKLKELASDTPCLLVMLSNPEAATWVVTAKP